MLKDLFLTPGRLLTRIIGKEKKRAYRSARSRPTESLATILLSVVCWLVLAGGVLYSVDKAGFLKQALDVGVEVATSGDAGEPGPMSPEDDLDQEATGSVTGSLKARDQAATSPPANVAGADQGPASRPAAANESWLVILHSIPKTDTGRQEAERRQTQYRSKGLRVEVYDTDGFPLLKGRQGESWWIVALGPYDTKAAALAASNQALSFTKELMVRRGL